MDCRELKYPDNSFDFVIDKSTIDALLCGDKAFSNVAKMIKVREQGLGSRKRNECLEWEESTWS